MSSPEAKISLRGLDGIRALAAVGVLVSHTFLSFDRFGLAKRDGLQFASSGVTIFFTLSGFLITYLLLQEKKRFGRISLRQFYLRRILRIWPLYFFYIALAVTIGLIIGEGADDLGYLTLFVLFLPNIAFNLNRYPADIGHLWSIGIEEQFYAFWPVVLSRVTRLVRFLVVLIIVLLVARTLLKFYSVHIGSKIPFSIAICMRFDCMATGALFAIAYDRSFEPVLRIARTIFVPVAFWAFVGLSVANHFSVFSIYTENVASIITGFFIVSQVTSTRALSPLDNPVAAFLGRISFGLYVYHPTVITVLATVFAKLDLQPASRILALVTVLATTVLVATASYKFLEKPFLRIKERFSPVKSGSA